jgi:hypothetical protein
MGGGGSWSGYQRKGHFAQSWHGEWRRDRDPRFSSQVSSGWFQRPYPYHLDYYRALYGGSYAPYFGNLYGPPNNYFFGTPFVGSPFYGGVSPFWGTNGFGPNGFWGGGFGNGGPNCDGPDCGGPAGYPNGQWSGGPVGPSGQSVESGTAEMPAMEP